MNENDDGTLHLAFDNYNQAFSPCGSVEHATTISCHWHSFNELQFDAHTHSSSLPLSPYDWSDLRKKNAAKNVECDGGFYMADF